MKKLGAGNIWSGSRTLAVFTNPTTLAKRKGNLKHDYPVMFRGKRYVDAEAAYQKVKRAGPWLSVVERERLMVKVIIAKLEQYPLLVETITDSGGLAWLEKCSHVVNGRSSWEGIGRKSGFVRCLIAAYQHMEVKPS